MYLNNWKQKDFEEFQKKFSKIFNVYNAKKYQKLILIKKNKNWFFISRFL